MIVSETVQESGVTIGGKILKSLPRTEVFLELSLYVHHRNNKSCFLPIRSICRFVKDIC